MLLKHGFNVNRESTAGTALHEAILHGRLEVSQLLCEHGADVNIKNVHGQTPLDVALKLSAAHSADKLAAIIASRLISGGVSRGDQEITYYRYFHPSSVKRTPVKLNKS